MVYFLRHKPQTQNKSMEKTNSAIMDGIFWKGSIEGSKYWSLIFKELTTGYEYV